jgi:tetratricopeptide (TPR) repeat protein
VADLTLSAAEVVEGRSWLWRLSGPGGELLAHHQVAVDPRSWEWYALTDLPRGIARLADPADRLGSEAALAERVGGWAAEHVLGPIGPYLAEAAPVTVSVVVPPQAPWLLGLPLGVAVVDGRPLAARRVSFAGSLEGWRPVAKRPVDDRLRVLAVFSVPEGETLLDLRRERKGLADLVGDLVGGGRARGIDLRVLQYGATPGRLADALAEGAGWDVVHFAGHGTAGRLVLEDEGGRPVVVPTAELVAWLRDARHRLKLVTLSACSSAAFTVAETLHALGVATAGTGAPAQGESASHALALEVAQQAECCVVAMRYPVVDDFAIAFGLALFEGLWDKEMDTATATAWATARAARFPPTPAAPALSAFTPAVFGPAAGLRLPPPVRTGDERPDTRMASFEPPPPRFVGRIGAMTRANAALAPRSGRRGVVFHGMAGAGKTACALELAYGQRDNFAALVWCRCPDEGADASLASQKLADLAGRLELALGVPVAGKVHDATKLARVAETITEAMEQRAVLVVLDNAESLLSAQGAWLDPRWGILVSALVAHEGRGRLVVTSRRLPQPPLEGLAVEAVHALGRDEAVLLARQLPNLGRLLEGTPAPTRDGRPLARAVLEATGGHPKLLELADAHASSPEVLEAMLAQAARVWADNRVDPSAFLREASAGAEVVAGYVALVAGWATRALAGLDESATVLAELLCRAHEADRNSWVVEANWADLWRRLGRPDPPPDHRSALAALTGAALVEADSTPGTDAETFTIHPLVAEAVAACTPEPVATAVDQELAAFWMAMLSQARETEAAGQAATQAVVAAARRGAVYLMRLGEWDAARAALEYAVRRDDSPAGRAEAVAQLRHVAAGAAGTEGELFALGVLARALAATDPAEAEQLMRRIEAEAVEAGRRETASAVATDLVNLLIISGHLREALDVTERVAGHTARAGHGPWTQMGVKGLRLQVLRTMGEYEQVLAEVVELVQEMEGLPDLPGGDEAVNPWNVRETLFDTAATAAGDLQRWDDALAWHSRSIASMQARGASELELARFGFNAYGPLLRTGRTGEARALLDACRAVFERHGAHPKLSRCLGALADLEYELGHLPQAIALEHLALRFKYLHPQPEDVSVSHFNLASYLARSGDKAASVAHRLAASVIRAMTGAGTYGTRLTALARQLVAGAPPPQTFDALCTTVEQVDGVRFRALVEALGGDGEEVMARVLADARAIPSGELYARQLAAWESALALLLASASGNSHARAHLDAVLARRGEQPDWAELAGRLARLRDGERDAAALTGGLDAIDTLVVTRALDALEGRVIPDPTPEPLRPLVEAVVALGAARRRAVTLTTEAQEVAGRVEEVLNQLTENEDWSALAAQLRTVSAGTTQVAWDGLDELDTAILATVLRRIDDDH